MKTIIIKTPEKVIIRVPEQGPAGPPGPPGGDLIMTAGESLGGHRMIYIGSAGGAFYADCSQITHAHRVIGMTTGAVESAGDFATIRLRGIIEMAGWAWDVEKEIFLGENGLLTQTPPTSGYILTVGYPVSVTSMDIRIQFPIFILGD